MRLKRKSGRGSTKQAFSLSILSFLSWTLSPQTSIPTRTVSNGYFHVPDRLGMCLSFGILLPWISESMKKEGETDLGLETVAKPL